MLKPIDEVRVGEALQKVESRQFVLGLAGDAAGLDLSDGQRGEYRFAGITNANDPPPEELDALERVRLNPDHIRRRRPSAGGLSTLTRRSRSD
jgi:hypothetical protein